LDKEGRKVAIGKKPEVGISSCLLGETVRYDGGHKLHTVIVDIIGPKVKWVSVCPEMEIGLGAPREPLNLVDDSGSAKLLASKTGKDWTPQMEEFTRCKLDALKSLKLDGYIFKNSSPSCGIDDVKLFRDASLGNLVQQGRGFFTRLFLEKFPNLPVTDEGKLSTVEDCHQFLQTIYQHQQNRDNHL
jgi:uncharacterized protein YbbK (DUF523 family)